ncbi:hypothetical protein [Azospirillum sp. SYSU D00513]|uniref:hypothetical protein n=1 Tax=Azospirillum sp. SYSU D00513 TaxID=2812561 RepID=UPI001A959195|nr:hypothetical protein [Azospirillum sp. SYSU D00513]
MMINFIILLAIIAVGAWLGNVLLSLEASLSQVRARMRAARDAISKVENAISRLQRDEERLRADIEEIAAETVLLRGRQAETQQRLAEAQAVKRPQLLILSERRNPGDKEWLVTVVNSQIGEIDATHPLALEWMQGREYLVWAESEREAAERANRRFGARPGYQVRSVAAIKDDIYAPRTAQPAA